MGEVLYATYEGDALNVQTREMTAFWERLGFPVDCVIGAGLNYFSLVDEFAQPESDFTRRQLSLIL